jgi:Leucine-rich repeat (LRR) protein
MLLVLPLYQDEEQFNTPPSVCLCVLQSGVEKLAQLRVLFLSNNRIRDWSEVDRLAAVEKLEELLLVGNPLYNDAKDANTLPDYRVEVRSAQQRPLWNCSKQCKRGSF